MKNKGPKVQTKNKIQVATATFQQHVHTSSPKKREGYSFFGFHI
jgi:hypothetical protein